jgi:peptidyl-prolyl cis-trans isomerase C
MAKAIDYIGIVFVVGVLLLAGYTIAKNLGGDEKVVKKVIASHILVKTEAEANEILFDVKNGKSFEDMAAEKSLCPSGKKGGSLGWFTRGQMVKEFEEAAFGGNKGDIIGPVKTQFGYHIIRIDDMA